MTQLSRATRLILVLTILTGVAYPLAVTGLAQVLFPWQANGSLLTRDGQVIGSALIGQKFAGDRYFHGRPSASDYDAAASGGSNLGPTSKALVEQVRQRAARLRDASGLPPSVPLPPDLLTASGSGLDPHISPAAAEVQIARVARARGLSEDSVRRLVARHTEGRQFGVFGEPRVNVLRLNLALDALR